MFSRGDIVKCKQTVGEYKRPYATAGMEYVVSGTRNMAGNDYLEILGDDRRGHALLADLFEKI